MKKRITWTADEIKLWAGEVVRLRHEHPMKNYASLRQDAMHILPPEKWRKLIGKKTELDEAFQFAYMEREDAKKAHLVNMPIHIEKKENIVLIQEKHISHFEPADILRYFVSLCERPRLEPEQVQQIKTALTTIVPVHPIEPPKSVRSLKILVLGTDGKSHKWRELVKRGRHEWTFQTCDVDPGHMTINMDCHTFDYCLFTSKGGHAHTTHLKLGERGIDFIWYKASGESKANRVESPKKFLEWEKVFDQTGKNYCVLG